MKKVITYGTYDLLHYGHIKLLERAKALGDYLIVGVTADDFDRTRGKINVQQSLMERVEAVRQTGLADEIIVEEYEGQKIDDVKKYGIDIFTVGSDWKGTFDYLNEFCKVVYLDRTEGVSSTEIRSQKHELKIGIVGESNVIAKFIRESKYVNGVKVTGICSLNKSLSKYVSDNVTLLTDDYNLLLKSVDAVYVISHPSMHYFHVKTALEQGKHVLCESPITLNVNEVEELFYMANSRNLALVDGIKTAYSTAYYRMILLAKGGKIGDIVSVDSICTSLKDIDYTDESILKNTWNSLTGWGPTAMLPIFDLLGTKTIDYTIFSRIVEENHQYDEFTKIAFHFEKAVASIKVGKGVKSEGELIISGTKGYIYVPAPWWKTEYFEIRYENPADNKRYFYQLDGEGIRNELLSFLKAIEKKGGGNQYIERSLTKAVIQTIEDFYKRNHLIEI